MLVDISHDDDRLHINVDIVFPKMPCDLITLSVQDVMGTNIADIYGSLHKKRISQTGEVLSQTSIFDALRDRHDMLNTIKEELEAK